MNSTTNEELLDLGTQYIPKDYPADLYRIRHSAAHVMAQAVIERFGASDEVELGIGPPIENGFYYDFKLPRSITDEDLAWIENRMKTIVGGKHPFHVRSMSSDEARTLFAGQSLKLELIAGLAAGEEDEYGNTQSSTGKPPITVYQQDTFFDLCRGPHVPDTSAIDPNAFKLLSLAGAYWRGDSSRPMLQRIYGTAWRSKQELDEHLHRLEEAEKRDHRKLGKTLELFHLDQTAPGMPYWLPNGLKILNLLIEFWRDEHEKRGYQEIASPLINEKSLWERSGHWEHYKDNMFIIPISERITYGVKPMNCPNAMIVYNLKTRSYRDLPLRLSDCDILHRNERSGTLHGLLRVQRIQQDDAHIFVTEDQIEEEYDRILDITRLFYGIFEMKYSFRLGTRPADFLGDIESWDKAEAALRRILDGHVGPGKYVVADGDGAFYGPKIDILMDDALGRSWQMGTIQLDFQLPRRFDCGYSAEDGSRKTPVVIHRVIYGSLERFIGILIEHTAGAFPVWLAPVQARLLPVADQHLPYCLEVKQILRDQGIRVDIDESNSRLNGKVREAQGQKIPYMLVVGNRDVSGRAVSVRLRTNEDLGSMQIEDFAKLVRRVADSRVNTLV
jgi:threonyl-tRNA synthetase